MEAKYIFVIIKYPAAETAAQALEALLGLAREGLARLKDGVAVTRSEDGEISLHRTQGELPGEGFLDGRLIGVIFADLFGSASWDVNGVFANVAFSMLGQGIKDKLEDEFGGMTPEQSAVALLVESANWRKAVDRMRPHNFQGKIVISQNVMEDLTRAERLLEQEKAVVAAVPEKLTVAAPKGLKSIEGIGDAYRKKLREAGVTNTDELLEKGSNPAGREEIVKATGVSDKLLLRWINMADLFRIRGIGPEYAELLEAAGVDTVPELAQRVPANLVGQMATANAQKKMVRRLPDQTQVESWVAQAKELPRKIQY
jgi:predicted flap endonuclease-1-like 5' DNA nuclease